MNQPNDTNSPATHVVKLFQGNLIPKARPLAKVQWEPGKPPGNRPVQIPLSQETRQTEQA